MAFDLEDPWRSSSLDQDGSRNYPYSVSLKQKVLKRNLFRSCPNRSTFRIFSSIAFVIAIVVFYMILVSIGQTWAKWRIHGNDLFYMFHLCSLLFAAVAIFILMVLFFIAIAIEEKVLNSDEEDREIEAPTWFRLRITHLTLGCFLFSFLAATMGWLTNNYVENGLSKRLDLDIDSFESYASAVIPYCFGLVSSIALALVFFSVILATSGVTISHIGPGRPVPVSVATTLHASSKVKISLVLLQLSILFEK
ncbi:hypothetical protein PTKIN_Ptkin09bG0047700 [Pterospermum kingtungense]